LNQKTVLVIGAGLAGIAAAARLAQRGVHVTVFEKNPHPGGRCDYLSHEGYHFDTGPTLFIMPRVYEAEFASLGASLHEMLDLQRVDPSYHLVFDDGSQLSLSSDLKAMQDQLEAIEPDSFQSFLRYIAEGCRHYNLAMPNLVERDFRTAGDFFNLGNLPLLFSLKPLLLHYNHMAAYFKEPRLKSAFTFQDVYMGLSPFEAPATFSMMSYTELTHGVWYPKGGMFRVVEALTEIALQAGVEFVFDTSVTRIEVDEQRATGLILEDGQRLEADAVLANADLPYVYRELLPVGKTAEQLARKRYSCSVVSFFWGLDKPYKTPGPHTLFLADDYRQNFDQIIRDLTIPSNPSVYVHSPRLLDTSMAPAGEDVMIAIVPVGHMVPERGIVPVRGMVPIEHTYGAEERDWKSFIEKARQAVFNRLKLLGIHDLEAHIKHETCFTPLSWHKRYNLVNGSTHGLCHNLTQLGYFRPSNRHARYLNLYFAGASTRPGTGMPTALISARLAAQRMLEDFNLP
jgi:phytoene desaturase